MAKISWPSIKLFPDVHIVVRTLTVFTQANEQPENSLDTRITPRNGNREGFAQERPQDPEPKL